MSPKFAVFLGMIIGSTIGGYIPTFFGVDSISYTTVLTSGIGSIIGIVIGYKLTRY